ncbi:MAG: sulfatase-like hydrolase/transferase [Capsulimonadaceae bacterium]|nr:sulfatase-like hydrolase/transferase [Capsulimonadaceae bacterium]
MNKKLNLLLITSDQQHFDTLGARNPRIKTPNLDRLAREGTRFDRAYTVSPVCSPARSTIITGMYPSWHGCWNLGCKLPEDVPTLGDALQQGGYATALIGKAHFQPLASGPDCESIECQPVLRDLDFWRKFNGPWYGFEHVELARNHTDESHVGQHYALWMEEKGLDNWRDYFCEWPPRPGEPVRRHRWDLPEELHYTTWTAERTMAAIEQNNSVDKPFFIWSSFHDPHPSYLVPEPWASLYDPDDMQPGELVPGELDAMPPHYALTQEAHPDFSSYNENGFGLHGFHGHRMDRDELKKDVAVYYGMISFMDRQIGRILDKLDELGLAENTLVVFTTDHGHLIGQHGLTAKGAFPYEDLLRIPFIVRCPGTVPQNTTSSAMQSLVDLAPTFLDGTGMDIPRDMQGISQLPVWRGATQSKRDHVMAEFHHQPTTMHLRTYIDERWKMTVYRDQSYGEFFDLQSDPGEHRNLWSDPARAADRAHVMQKFLNAELLREPMISPQVAGA